MTIVVILITTIAVRGSNNMIQTTVPLLAHYNFGFPKYEVGYLSSLFGIASFLATTYINPRMSAGLRRVVFMVSSAVYTLVILAFFFTSSIMLWPLNAASGALTGLLMPNLITSAGLFRDRKIRERSISLYTTALSISLIFGPSLESYILKIFPLEYAFLFFAPFGLVASVLSPFIRFPSGEPVRQKRKFEFRSGFNKAVFLNLSYNIPFILITVFAGIYAHTDLGVSYSTVTLYYTVFFTTSFFSRLFLSVRRPAENMHFVVALTMALTLAGLTIIFFSTDSLIFGIAMAVMGIPHGLSFPVSLVYISRDYEPELRHSANSYFFSAMTVVMVAGPILGGYAIQSIGFRLTFLFLLPVIVVLAILIYRSERKSRES